MLCRPSRSQPARTAAATGSGPSTTLAWPGTGELDTFGARPAMARHVQAAMPGSMLRLLPEGVYISILSNHVKEILAQFEVDW